VFIYGLFNDSNSSSGHVACDSRMLGELPSAYQYVPLLREVSTEFYMDVCRHANVKVICLR
jgi:hypothetical protein